MKNQNISHLKNHSENCELTVRNPPKSCPNSMLGLLSAVANIKPPNIEPIPVKIPIVLTFLQGIKKAANAMIGLAIAFKVTARW